MLDWTSLNAAFPDPRSLAACEGLLVVGLVVALFAARRTARRAVASRNEAETRLRTLVEAMREGVLIRDQAGGIVLTNAQAREILGLTLDQISGQSSFDASWCAIHEDGRIWERQDWPSNVALREGEAQRDRIMGVRMPWGETIWLSVSAVPLVHPSTDRPHSVVTVISDVTVRKRREQRNRSQVVRIEDANAELSRANALLADMALTDGLTGLKNYRAFQERLADEVATGLRDGRPLSLILLDVDEFKSYNDRFGHPEGDEALRKVAEVLRSIARGTDLVARYGGEEFAVLLPEVDEKGALAVAERLRAAIQGAPWTKRNVTASFGVATWGEEDDADRLVARADAALYQAKKAGRNRVRRVDFPGENRSLAA